MAVVGIDAATGSLLVGGKKVFPIVLSNGPPPASVAPNGRNGLAEVAAAGVGFLRTGTGNWSPEFVAGQIQNERTLLDAAGAHGLRCWTWLGKLPNLPTTAGSTNEQLLTQVVNALKGHAALGAWKGIDEPAFGSVPAAGLVRAYKRIRALDPNHPLVIIQAPRGTVADLKKYAPALDITGADVYPVGYPPGRAHGQRRCGGRRPRDAGVGRLPLRDRGQARASNEPGAVLRTSGRRPVGRGAVRVRERQLSLGRRRRVRIPRLVRAARRARLPLPALTTASSRRACSASRSHPT